MGLHARTRGTRSGGGSTTTADGDERASLRRNRWARNLGPRREPLSGHLGFYPGSKSSSWSSGRSFASTGSSAALSAGRDLEPSIRGLSLAQLGSWSSIVNPGNPPLYYSVLHGWLRFGDSEAALRIPSMVFGVLTIPLVYALGRTIRDHRLGLVAALLFAISPFQVWYSQEARGYSLVTLGATSAMWGSPTSSPPGTIGYLRATGWALLAYVFGTMAALLAHDTAVFLPIGANLLLLGWWWTHGRSRGAPCATGCSLRSRALPVGQLASGLPAPGRRRWGVLLDPRRPWAAC